MFETPLTVVGNIVNDPIRRSVGDQEVLKFRVASNSRRRAADGTWEPGNSLFVTVNCWGRLVSGVGASLGKGSPVIVAGHVHTSEYEDRDGIRRSTWRCAPARLAPTCLAASRASRRRSLPGRTPRPPRHRNLALRSMRTASTMRTGLTARTPRLPRMGRGQPRDTRKATLLHG